MCFCADDDIGSIWVISLGAAIVLTGIMVAVGLSVLICAKCRCRKLCSRRSTHSFDMPPPYSGPPFTICRTDNDSSASVATTTTPDATLRHGDASVAKVTVVKTIVPDVSPAAEIRRAKDGGVGGGTRGVDVQRPVSVFERADEATGAVGGTPFVRAFTPQGHFEMPSPGSSILSYLPSSDDDTSSLISHTCDYY